MVKGFCDIMREWKSEAQLDTPIMVSRYPENSEVLKIMTTSTESTGVMIGYKGELINKYREKLRIAFPDIKEIQFIESDSVII